MEPQFFLASHMKEEKRRNHHLLENGHVLYNATGSWKQLNDNNKRTWIIESQEDVKDNKKITNQEKVVESPLLLSGQLMLLV